jgi:hypothetical protein
MVPGFFHSIEKPLLTEGGDTRSRRIVRMTSQIIGPFVGEVNNFVKENKLYGCSFLIGNSYRWLFERLRTLVTNCVRRYL